ncbi:hypothetical protein AFE_1025 [Acidithiobacillus ferrooxidans ATCC 23270]|uniref:Uncharacterized protein n=2 Tax=Acidithiobacillaceae TaxID=225058 RepID=B7J7K0_ACIF2|nr:hypothetical protein AFE_1025 [Acidithiobacillus ferrooxidans ATCC 23270]
MSLLPDADAGYGDPRHPYGGLDWRAGRRRRHVGRATGQRRGGGFREKDGRAGVCLPAVPRNLVQVHQGLVTIMEKPANKEMVALLKKPLSIIGWVDMVFLVAILALVISHRITMGMFEAVLVAFAVIQSIVVLTWIYRVKKRLQKDF